MALDLLVPVHVGFLGQSPGILPSPAAGQGDGAFRPQGAKQSI